MDNSQSIVEAAPRKLDDLLRMYPSERLKLFHALKELCESNWEVEERVFTTEFGSQKQAEFLFNELVDYDRYQLILEGPFKVMAIPLPEKLDNPFGQEEAEKKRMADFAQEVELFLNTMAVDGMHDIQQVYMEGRGVLISAINRDKLTALQQAHASVALADKLKSALGQVVPDRNVNVTSVNSIEELKTLLQEKLRVSPSPVGAEVTNLAHGLMRAIQELPVAGDKAGAEALVKSCSNGANAHILQEVSDYLAKGIEEHLAKAHKGEDDGTCDMIKDLRVLKEALDKHIQHSVS